MGKFIVIEGIDGSGKATQTKILETILKEKGYKVASISFPSYHKRTATFVEKFLKGEFGPLEMIDPYVASSFYILDRFGQRETLMQKLEENDVVISDRYSISNFIHRWATFLEQGDHEGLQLFFSRLKEFEFERAKLPQPDLIIFLSLSMRNIQKLLEKKAQEERSYVTSADGLDTAEKNISHQGLALTIGQEILPSYFENYQIIKCEDGHGTILEPEKIHKKIMEAVEKSLEKKTGS